MTKFLRQTIKQAGKVVVKKFRQQQRVSLKADKSLLTEADLLVEKLIMDNLKRQYAGIPILSEETRADFDPVKQKKLFVLDPIDGTTNFAYGDSYFCLSLAYVEENGPQIGLVYAPVLDKLFVAEKRKGAWLNGKKIKVSKRQKLSQCLLAFGTPYETKRRQLMVDWFAELADKVRFFRAKGAAVLQLAEIAAGSIDVYLESSLNPWDFAAAMLLIEEAGGRVTNLDNQVLKMQTSHLLATNGHYHQQILSIIVSCNIDKIPIFTS